mgnify:CR=1 FL=1
METAIYIIIVLVGVGTFFGLVLALADKKFVITGSLRQFKNRAELQKIIEDNGGKVLSSVSKNANYLINNDINSTSAKNVAAKKLNIPIITEADFMELLN